MKRLTTIQGPAAWQKSGEEEHAYGKVLLEMNKKENKGLKLYIETRTLNVPLHKDQ